MSELVVTAVVIVLLLVLLWGIWPVVGGWGRMRKEPSVIKVTVTPTSPSVAVAQPSSSAPAVMAAAESAPAAAASAVKECMSSNKWSKAWY